ncbi:SSU ribosomal protein S6p [Oenococcus kitaharae DSM 17330]|uniref:Small ribosomal subunit protein bS6 n=1 Tax=Oenococcus kitaharae DSM 17330 TaxID=1045004 RepID=G9WF09_9LACO|nr:SSU ribosomal protein S6p [Oenococcus kitaharae DSM 17330]OEY84717.1 30S ribosomal protein S6 [Oenococcus kitaharae]OEY85001.1 30S ribosomal protein S6 [Oenococcus kitaharae]OEY85791.1 30S ribosomal protein S6 [Oenococcus kitaharae]
MASYELTYIVRPDLDKDAKAALVARFDKVLTDNGATIDKSEDWNSRRFTYEINGYREGTYHVVVFAAADDKATNEFDRLAKISEDILRHMIVAVDPAKLADAHAKQAAAAQRAAERRAQREAERSAAQAQYNAANEAKAASAPVSSEK